jgi:hypothetical protein
MLHEALSVLFMGIGQIQDTSYLNLEWIQHTRYNSILPENGRRKRRENRRPPRN